MFGNSRKIKKLVIEMDTTFKCLKLLEAKVRKLEEPNKPKYNAHPNCIGYSFGRQIFRYSVGRLNKTTWEYDKISHDMSEDEARKIVDCLNGKCEPTVKESLTVKKKGKRNVE